MTRKTPKTGTGRARAAKGDDVVRGINEFVQDEHNARRRTDRSRAAIVHSLETFGAGRSILIDADDNVIAGNGTLDAAADAGIARVRVVEVDGDELVAVKRRNLRGLEARAMAIADNRTAELSVWDYEQLDDTLADLVEGDVAIGDLGFDETELQDMLGDVADGRTLELLFAGQVSSTAGEDDETVEPEPAPTAPQEAQRRWKVKVGDLWKIEGSGGSHRILCGDVTSAADVTKLFHDGQQATLIVADPPYGMGKESDGVLNDNIYGAKLDEFQLAWFRAVRSHVADKGSSAYIWGNAEDLWRLWFAGGLKDTEKLTLRNEIVWDKVSIPGMKSDLMTQFPVATERCLFIQFGDQFIGNLNSDQYWEGWDEIRVPLADMANAAKLNAKRCVEVTGTQMFAHWFSKSQWQMINADYYGKLQAAFPDAFTTPYAELREKYDAIKGGYRSRVNGILGGMRAYFDNSHDSMTDVWQFGRVVGDERFGHATPKPVAMMERHVLSSCPEGGIVVEPFGGTGPVMLACERTGRSCRTIELQPEYVAVILDRMHAAGCKVSKAAKSVTSTASRTRSAGKKRTTRSTGRKPDKT